MSRELPVVAIVDDDVDVRVALSRLAAAAGLSVECFGSGPELLRSLNDLEPDCIVLDLQMPNMSGHDLQVELTARGSRVPVVAITGHDSPEARSRAIQLGASGYLPKPIELDALLTAIGLAMKADDGAPWTKDQ